MFEFVMLIVSLAIGEIFRPKATGLEEHEEYHGPEASEARPVPYLFGVAPLVSANIIWHGDMAWRHLSRSIKTGMVGTHNYIYAYTYHIGMHLGLTVNELDALVQIWVGDSLRARCRDVGGMVNGGPSNVLIAGISGSPPPDVNWPYSNINFAPALVSSVVFYKGKPTQQPSIYLGTQVGTAPLPAYRRISSFLIEGASKQFVGAGALGAGGTTVMTSRPSNDFPIFNSLQAGFNGSPSGAIGTSATPAPYTFVCKYIPTALGLLPGGNTTHSTIGALDPTKSLGGINLQTGTSLPYASGSNAGQWYTVTVTPRGAFVDEVENLVPDYYYVGSYIVSSGNGKWYKFDAPVSANPAEVIYQIMTDQLYALGISAALIDATSFQAAAATLYSEGFGISGVIDKQSPGREVISDILRYINGILYVDVQAGKFKLRLIRTDYTVAGLRAAGKVFNQDNIRSFTKYSKNPIDETTNEIKVEFTNTDAGFAPAIAMAQDTANIVAQGKVVSQTIKYPFIPNINLATRVAWRDLRIYSASLARAEIKVDRTVYDVEPGDAWVLDWPPLDIVGLPVRVMIRRENEPVEGTIELDIVEDVFTTGTALFGFGNGAGEINIDTTPMPVTVKDIVAAPYQSTRADGTQKVDFLAGAPTAASLQFTAHQKLSTVVPYYDSEIEPSYNPTGLLSNEYPESAGWATETDPAAVDARASDFTSSSRLTLGSLLRVNSAAYTDAAIQGGAGIALLKSSSTYEYVGYSACSVCDGFVTVSYSGGWGDKGGLANRAITNSAIAETWTLVYLGSGLFSVTGSISGVQANATVGIDYENAFIKFLLYEGVTAFSVSDTITLVVDPTKNGLAQLTGVWRGLRNTVPQTHPSGTTRVWLRPDQNRSSILWSNSVTVDAKYADMTASGLYALTDITDGEKVSVALSSDSKRPYPPADVRVKIEPGGSYGTWAPAFYGNGSAADMDIAWRHRDRPNQTTEIKQDDTSLTAIETGCTYTLKFYSGDTTSGPWTLERTYSSLTGLQQTYPQATMLSDYNTMVGGVSVFPKDYKVEMTTTRTADGLVSTQTQTRIYECAGADYLADYYAD